VSFFYSADAMTQAIEDGNGRQLNHDGGPCLYDLGSRIVISDGDGNTVATVKLADGVNRVSSCVLPFAVSLPDKDFYTFEVSDETETFSREELEAGDPVDITVT
jgi:hypothetical protein